MTAHYLMMSTYKLQAGETCLIHSGAGGMGLLLIQLAKNIGATAITTVSTSAKAALAKDAGADVVINYAEQDFAEETKKATGGKGVNVVYDAVGKDTFDKSVASLAPLGMMVLYGAASGPVPAQDLGFLSGRSLFLTRPGLPAYTASREDLLWRANDVMGWVSSGALKLTIHSERPLSGGGRGTPRTSKQGHHGQAPADPLGLTYNLGQTRRGAHKGRPLYIAVARSCPNPTTLSS